MAGDRPDATLGAIAGVFARYGNLTWGGGTATVGVLREQMIDRRGWITPGESELAFALCRLTPGTNLLAYCVAVGWMLRRWLGAIVSLLAASIPCSVAVVLMTVFYEQLSGNPWFRDALVGAMAAAVAITVSTAWTFVAPHLRAAPVKALVVIPGTAALSLGLQLSPVLILLLAALVGVSWPAKTEVRA